MLQRAILPCECLLTSLLQPPVDEHMKAALKAAVDTMQAENYVRGDLRCQNMVVDKKVHVLDFDWAGRCGTARYPVELNMCPTCNWYSNVESGGIITKEHNLSLPAMAEHQLK